MSQMSARCALRGVGQLRSFHLRTAMPNELDVSEVYTARGRAAKVLPLTLYNAEWARCQRGVRGEEWGDKGPSTYVLQCRMGQMSAGCARRGVGATKVRPLTLCNAEWARCQQSVHCEGSGR